MSIELQAFGANAKAKEMSIIEEEEDLSPKKEKERFVTSQTLAYIIPRNG